MVHRPAMNLKDCWHTILPIQRNSRRFHQSSTENIMNASTNNQVFPFVGTKPNCSRQIQPHRRRDNITVVHRSVLAEYLAHNLAQSNLRRFQQFERKKNREVLDKLDKDTFNGNHT